VQEDLTQTMAEMKQEQDKTDSEIRARHLLEHALRVTNSHLHCKKMIIIEM
jgi:uncharacterized membrane protein YgaE (UPF0421/DUF939 family)